LLPSRKDEVSACDGNSSVEDLRRSLAEVRKRNAELQKRLDARPIVYQFAPGDGADCTDLGAEELGGGDDLEDSAVDEAGGNPGPGGPPAAAAGAGWRRLGRRAARRVVRGARLLRRQRHVRSSEQWLRRITHRILQDPLLLWFFYLHLLVLWFVEIRRHTLARPASCS